MKRSLLLTVALAAVAMAGAAFACNPVDLHGLVAHAMTQAEPTWLLAAAPVALIRSLKAKKNDALQAANSLNAITDRELTAEEQTALDGHIASITSLNAQIERAEFLANQDAGLNADGGVVIDPRASLTVSENVALDPKRGYQSFNEYASDLIKAGRTGEAPKRLRIGAAAPSTFGGEGAGADGGFLVPPAFSSEIFTLALTDDALLPLTDNTPVGGNGMVFPKDETTPWGTNGVRAYWQAEATAATATKPVLGTQAMRLHKLMALVPLTNELVDDSVAGGAFVMPLVARSIRWKSNEAILFGTGEGQPQGMFNSGAVQQVSKDSGQAANTLTVTNVANMIAQLPPGAFGESQWLITPDALPSLFTMTLGNYPIYLPSSAGAVGSPYGTLMGRPLNVSQHVGAFSTKGDLSLIVPSWYRTITKAGAGVQAEQSMHLYFDADVTAFRATFRMDGGSKIAAGIAQAKGSKVLSPFLQLQAR